MTSVTPRPELLRLGDNGPHVAEMQERLQVLRGTDGGPLYDGFADGDFGEKSHLALQHLSNMSIDGQQMIYDGQDDSVIWNTAYTFHVIETEELRAGIVRPQPQSAPAEQTPSAAHEPHYSPDRRHYWVDDKWHEVTEDGHYYLDSEQGRWILIEHQQSHEPSHQTASEPTDPSIHDPAKDSIKLPLSVVKEHFAALLPYLPVNPQSESSRREPHTSQQA